MKYWRIIFNLLCKWYDCIWLNKIVTFKKIITLHSVEVCPNSLLLLVIVFWRETNRGSFSQIFFKIGISKNFAILTGKFQYWSLFLIKLLVWEPATLLKSNSSTSASLWNLRNFTEHFFYKTSPLAASEQTQEISLVCFVVKWYFGHLAQVHLVQLRTSRQN